MEYLLVGGPQAAVKVLADSDQNLLTDKLQLAARYNLLAEWPQVASGRLIGRGAVNGRSVTCWQLCPQWQMLGLLVMCRWLTCSRRWRQEVGERLLVASGC